VVDEPDDRIAHGLGNPGSVRSPPKLFFYFDMPIFDMFIYEFGEGFILAPELRLRGVILRSSASPARRARGSKAAEAFSKNSLCQR
jgi:hypothetical protein